MARSSVSKSRKGKSRSPKMSRTKSRTKSRTRRTKSKRANTSKVRRRGAKRSKTRKQIKNLKGGVNYKYEADWFFSHYPFEDEIDELYAIVDTADKVDIGMKKDKILIGYKFLDENVRAIIAGYTALYIYKRVDDDIGGFINYNHNISQLTMGNQDSKYPKEALKSIAKLMKDAYKMKDAYRRTVFDCLYPGYINKIITHHKSTNPDFNVKEGIYDTYKVCYAAFSDYPLFKLKSAEAIVIFVSYISLCANKIISHTATNATKIFVISDKKTEIKGDFIQSLKEEQVMTYINNMRETLIEYSEKIIIAESSKQTIIGESNV